MYIPVRMYLGRGALHRRYKLDAKARVAAYGGDSADTSSDKESEKLSPRKHKVSRAR